ncbi:hypothetical protein [Desertibaculum subflavum]|uniref:hypothetical protein n=1 Tax=Desertibaculum subflavum TaxID=2268458 RepID=UPI000E665656
MRAGDAMQLIRTAIDAETSKPVTAGVQRMVAAVRERFGPAVAGIIFYGSCLRAGTTEGVLDFYAIVDSYEAAFGSGLLALGNRLVPPNVFHLKAMHGDGDLRAKVAVLSLDDLDRLTRPDSRQTSVWARFCQPTGIVYARDEAVRGELVERLSQAVVTAIGSVAPLLPADLSPAELWTQLFAHTFGAEFRTERSDRPAVIYRFDSERYDRLARPALAAAGIAVAEAGGKLRLTIAAPEREAARRGWRAKVRRGKSLTLLRLVKAVYTFDGGVDYLIWKAERHSGRKVDVSAFARAHPILCAPVVFWRAWRQGVFR